MLLGSILESYWWYLNTPMLRIYVGHANNVGYSKGDIDRESSMLRSIFAMSEHVSFVVKLNCEFEPYP